MIFRRSTTSSSSAGKTQAASQIQSRQQTSTTTNSTQTRREPELSATPAPQKPTAITPPISPLAVAQARRNPNGPAPAYGSSRQEQLRKLTVGRDISLNGEIATCDHLVVEGNVSATIKGGQVLEIMETGAFSGVVDIDFADIAGKFDGDLTVRNKLVLRPSAIVTGTIRYGALQVDNGAVLNGQISALQTTATDSNTYTPSSFTSANAASETNTYAATSSTTMQSNYLSSVLDQPGFLKASGQ